MLRNVSRIERYEIHATNESLGKIHDIFFDDRLWRVRYFVVDTAGWFSGRRVLISPMAVTATRWDEESLLVNLTRAQVEAAPGVDTDKPLSRQQEETYAGYYGWPKYWVPVQPVESDATTAIMADQASIPVAEQGDPHLRSANEVMGYDVEAKDGNVGLIEDFLLDDEDWTVRYAVVDTGEWLLSRKLVLAPGWFTQIRWDESCAYTDLERDAIHTGPEYNPSVLMARQYEAKLHEHYGRTPYWP